MSKTKFEYFIDYLEKGNTEGVRIQLEKEFLEKIINSSGRPIHVACEKGYTSIVKLLIDEKCNIESENNYKSRPIHYACNYGHIDIVKILIEQKCQIEPKDGYGHTPLDLAKSNGHKDIVTLINNEIEFKIKHSQILNAIVSNNYELFGDLYSPGILTTTDGASGQSWLELAFKERADKVLEWFLDRPIDHSEIVYFKNITENESKNSINIQLWNEVLLYKCIRDHDEDSFQFLCCANVVNAQRKIIPSSFLEVAAEHGRYFFVLEILKKFIRESETWERAKKIATDKGHIHIEKLISKRESLLKYRHGANLSILHTAVFDNDPDMVQYILDSEIVDPNLNHEILGTALALSIVLCQESCVKVLERLDCNTRNRYLQSPLLEAISNGMIEHCSYLMNSAININEEGFMGQTVLHSAVMRGCEDLCNQLMEKGADCNLYMKFLQRSDIKDPLSISKRENSLTLCVKINKTIYPCFLGTLDQNTVNSCDDEGNSLLHLCVNLLDTQICNTLIEAGANVDAINKEGHTPLFELLSQLDKRIFDENDETFNKNISNLLKSLLIKGIHADERGLYYLAKFNDHDGFDCLLNIEIPHPMFLENGETLLTRLLKEGKSDFCQKIIQSEINKKKYTNFKNQKNETPLQVAIETESMDIIQDLIFESENLNNEDNEGLTALMQLFQKISTTNEKSRYFTFLNAIKMIIMEGGDIYHNTSEGVNIIELCIREDTRNEIEKSFKIKQQKNIVKIKEEIFVNDDKIFRKNCGVCLDNEVDTVFQCGHTICRTCSERLLRCPFCNHEPVNAKRIYFN